MPILHQGSHICSRCRAKFDWIHFEFTRQKLSDHLTVEHIPNQLKVHRFIPTPDGKAAVYVNCPHCDFYNRFLFPELETNE